MIERITRVLYCYDTGLCISTQIPQEIMTTREILPIPMKINEKLLLVPSAIEEKTGNLRKPMAFTILCKLGGESIRHDGFLCRLFRDSNGLYLLVDVEFLLIFLSIELV